VYSSGAGIALGLVIRHLLGLSVEADVLSLDPVMPAALDGLRIATSLLEQPLEVHYHIAGAGCGVTAVSLNGEALALTYAPNPHRRGAALVSKQAFREQLKRAGNVLSVSLGN
jgi:cellobiose phosphorylase